MEQQKRNQNINISSSNTIGKCNLKCAYNFKYTQCNLTAKNDGIMINLKCDNSSNTVIYNFQKYSVSQIYIVSPSIHIFNRKQLAGEFVIVHNPLNGGPLLNVSIPFISSTDSSTATTIITEIINNVAEYAPSEGDSANLNLTDFNLESIVPTKPFYMYNSEKSSEIWLVYDSINGIPLNQSTVDTLQKIIKPSNIPTKGDKLFLNSLGPNVVSKIKGDGIYISCQPTGNSDDTTEVTNNKSTNVSSNDLNLGIMYQVLIYGSLVIFFILFLYFINNGFTKLRTLIGIPNIGISKPNRPKYTALQMQQMWDGSSV